MDERLLWVAPALVLSVGLWRPRVGLALLAASLPLFGTPPAGPYLAALDAMVLAAVLVGLRARRRPSRVEAGPNDRRATDRPRWGPLDWAVAAWVTVSLVSLIPAAYHPPAWRPALLLSLAQSLHHAEPSTLLYSWRATEKLLLGLALFWSCRRVFAGRSIRPLANGLAAGLAYLVLLGFAEYLGLVDLSAYRAIGAELYDARLHSLFFHSGWLAQYVIVATPFAIAGVALGSRRSQRGAVVLLALTLLAILLTQQRGAWITALAQLGFLGVVMGPSAIRSRRTLRNALAVLAVFLAAILVISRARLPATEVLVERLGTTTADLSGRALTWSQSLKLSEERYFLGFGLGSFAGAYGEHPGRQTYRGAWQTAHSLYVHTLFERGVLGLIALALVALAASFCLRPILRVEIRDRGSPHGVPQREAFEKRTLALGLATSLVGVAVYGIVQYIFYLASLEWLCWLLVGAISVLGADRGLRAVRLGARAVIVLAIVSIPLRLGALEPSAGVGQASFGLHLPELKPDARRVRWTAARAALRVPWNGETLLVELIDGHPRSAERSLEVVLEVDGRQVWRGPVTGSWRQVRLELGPGSADFTVLEIVAGTAFRPFQEYRRHEGLEATRDIRSLGVAVGRIRWLGAQLQDHMVSGAESYSHAAAITLGNLGMGDYVVGPSGSLTLRAPLVILADGFEVRGRLTIESP